jgi:hypothetical protein
LRFPRVRATICNLRGPGSRVGTSAANSVCRVLCAARENTRKEVVREEVYQ